MKRAIFFLSLFLIQHTSFIIGDAHAQLSGSVSLGGQVTNNVQSLDTIAPDQMLMPAFELDYDVHPSNVSTISLTGSYTPSFYNLNPGLSFQETSIGATGVFYLSHQDAISAEAAEKGTEEELKPQHNAHFRRLNNEDPLIFFAPPNTLPIRNVISAQQSKNDSLVDVAVTELYVLSGELDSTNIADKRITKTRLGELGDLRDSVSEVISTIANLLDSAGYSESISEVIVSELEGLRAPMHEVSEYAKPSRIDTNLLDAAIRSLQQATPDGDYLPTPPTPSAPPGASIQTKKLIHSLELLPASNGPETPLTPNLTLLTSSTRLREFGYKDATVHEDADDSGATTLATALTIPVAYTNHAGVHYSPADSILFGANFGGNPNDNKLLTFGAAMEGLTSTSFSLRGAYDLTHEDFPFDSVYSSTENRFTFTPRLALGKSTVLIGEGAIGFKKYLDPLLITDSVIDGYDTTYDTTRNKNGRIISIKPVLKDLKREVSHTAAANFYQVSYGMGLSEFIGEHWVVGALADFNYNPALRAYVTSAEAATKKVRAAAQIADDEYTYNLGRYSIFSNSRIFADLDFGVDLSYEHRYYGAAVGPKGAVLYGDSSRTEDGEFLNASLSKLFVFNDRWIGIFSGLLLEGKLELDNVVSTEPLYSYTLTAFTITTTLTF